MSVVNELRQYLPKDWSERMKATSRLSERISLAEAAIREEQTKLDARRLDAMHARRVLDEDLARCDADWTTARARAASGVPQEGEQA